MPDFLRFTLLFSALYLAFGVLSPFLPIFLASRGMSPQEIGFLLFAGAVIRLVSGPAASRLADDLRARRLVLATCCAVSAAAAAALASVYTFAAVLVISLCHAAMLAPTTTLSDALAVRRARDEHTSAVRFEYGWVRGAGSAAFIVGLLASGQVLDAFPPALSLAAQASILVIAAGTALLVPEIDTPLRRSVSGAGRALPDLRLLLSNRPFRRLVIIAALVLGSHAMHDGFATIAWHAAGISPSTTSVLWSESVAAEVLVFFLLGPLILRNMSPGAAMVISASAAMLRWLVMSQSSSVFALALLEPLHGFSFALLHLACMRVLARVTPGELAATAQAIYALAIAIVSALLTFVSGFVYAQFGLGGFIVMALIGAASLPVIIGGRHQLMLN